MNPYYPFVAQRAKHKCEYCHAPEVIFNVAFEVDHIIPISKKGGDEENNLSLCCRICNLRKLDYIEGIDPLTKEKVRLFHPRIDLWNDHFTFNQKYPFIIEGKTNIGRATIERLDLNYSLQLKARELWIKLGIFP